MALIHHNDLRVNSEVPDDTVEIWREHGWKSGPHKDSDPDDHSAVPLVLAPAVAVVPEPETPAKATAKADKKDS